MRKQEHLFNLSRPEGIMEMIIMCQERFPPDSIFWLYLKILGMIMSNSIKLSSWVVGMFISTEQRILFLLLLRNENAKQSVHKNQPLVSILSHINPTFNHKQPLSLSLSLVYNIVIISVPRLLYGLLPSSVHLKFYFHFWLSPWALRVPHPLFYASYLF
jgi:hypothetical protein